MGLKTLVVTKYVSKRSMFLISLTRNSERIYHPKTCRHCPLHTTGSTRGAMTRHWTILLSRLLWCELFG